MDVTADDLLPLIAKLSPEERVRLSRIALSVTQRKQESHDATLYRAVPPGDGEFGGAEDPLAWDAAGWDEIA